MTADSEPLYEYCHNCKEAVGLNKISRGFVTDWCCEKCGRVVDSLADEIDWDWEEEEEGE